MHAGEPIVAAEPSTTERAEAEQAAAGGQKSPDWVPLFAYEESPYAASGCQPAAIRFWDGSVLRVEHWTDVLTVTVEKLCSEKMLTEADTPVLSKNRKKHLVGTEPVDVSQSAPLSAITIQAMADLGYEG